MPIPGQIVPVNSLLKVRTITYDPNAKQLGLNVSYWKVTHVVGTSVTDAFVANTYDAVQSVNYKSTLPASINYIGTGVQVLIGIDPMPPEQFELGNGGAGAVAGVVSAPQLAAFASFRTTVAGRTGRGRKYYPFVPPSFQTGDGILTNPAVALYDAITQVMATPQTIADGFGNSLDMTPVITNLTPNSVSPTAFGYFNQIVLGTTSNLLATQRRRGQFGRQNLPVS